MIKEILVIFLLCSVAMGYTLPATTMNGNLTMGSNYIKGLPTPSASTDAATKGYVDSSTGELDAGYLIPQTYGAEGDGNHNDTQALQDCIDAADAAGKSVFLPIGTYLINGTGINIPRNMTIQGSRGVPGDALGSTSTIYYDGLEAMLIVETATDEYPSNIRLSDFNLYSSSCMNNQTSSLGIYGVTCTDVVIENIGFYNIQVPIGLIYPTNVLITDCTFDNVNTAFYAYTHLNVLIDRCKFNNTGMAAFICDGTDFAITNSYFERVGTLITFESLLSEGGSFVNTRFSGNHVNNTLDYAEAFDGNVVPELNYLFEFYDVFSSGSTCNVYGFDLIDNFICSGYSPGFIEEHFHSSESIIQLNDKGNHIEIESTDLILKNGNALIIIVGMPLCMSPDYLTNEENVIISGYRTSDEMIYPSGVLALGTSVSANTGCIWLNTSSGYIEYYDGSSIQVLAVS